MPIKRIKSLYFLKKKGIFINNKAVIKFRGFKTPNIAIAKLKIFYILLIPRIILNKKGYINYK